MHTIIGAIIGDIIGSTYEGRSKRTKSMDFELYRPWSTFTDDTVLTVAVADLIMSNKPYVRTMHEYTRKYPNRGYGGGFRKWIASNHPKPYNSYGNGSAMRVSPVSWAFDSVEKVMEIAQYTAEVSHNHEEGIKGAQAIAVAGFLARQGESKQYIREEIEMLFDYDLDFTIEQIRPNYYFDVTCQGSVPQAIVSFLDSNNFEEAIRLAISLGGDSDTLACMAGGIAAAYYQDIPEKMVEFAYSKLGDDFIQVVREFDLKYGK